LKLKKAIKKRESNSENLMNDVFNRITEGVFALDKNWHFIYVNQKAMEILNRKSVKDLLDKNIWTEYPEKVSQPMYGAYHKAINEQKPVFIEEFYLSFNKWFENRIYPSEDGLTIHLIEITDRKYNELSLLERGDPLRNLFMNHCSMMLLIEPDSGSILYANLSAEKFYGYPISSLCTMNINEINILPSNSKETTIQLLQKTHQPVISSHRLAGGEIRTVEVHSSTFVSNGKLILSSIINDITERKQTEDALRRTQFTIDQAREEVFWINLQGKLIYVNDAVSAVLGYSKEELSQMTIFDIDTSLTKEIWTERWTKTIGKTGFIFETLHKTKEGKIIPVEISVSSLNIDHETIHCSFVHDITERKSTEHALENDRFLLKTLINNLPCSVFVKDKNYRKVLINPVHVASVASHLRGLGLDLKTEIIGKTDFDVYPKELAEKYFADDQKVIQEGTTKLFDEERTIKPNGQPTWYLISKIPLRDKSGTINGLVGITFDITAQKQIEEALIKTKEELIKINRNQQMLSKCNEVLVRATGENHLLNEICRIIVEVGQYNFAWVGFADGIDFKSIRPVAQAGLNEDFINKFNISVTDTEQNYMSIIEAIHSGTPVVLKDPARLDTFFQRYQNNLTGSYTSVISLPLSSKEKNFWSIKCIFVAAGCI
jgi:PAS domain S-box-containing protein